MSPGLNTFGHRVTHPPVREPAFWVAQVILLTIATVHLLVDMRVDVASSPFPAGIPVALLVVPVGFTALRYGLAGSAASGAWAIVLWLPDLLLPPSQGHVGGDLVDLILIIVVALVFGDRIDAERLARARVERATAESMAVGARYRKLFETNSAPILVIDALGTVSDANPAAVGLFGPEVLGVPVGEVSGVDMDLRAPSSQTLALPDGHDYRIELVAIPDATGAISTQVIFEDVTAERSEGRRASHYAALVVKAEEDQRSRLARELHDEPLQLFLHLARRIETLGASVGVPERVSGELDQVRLQALDAAGRLRTLAHDLRPPTLDRLGLLAALTSLIADLEDESGLTVHFDVLGTEIRTAPELELAAFRIVQEALRNVVRHADTKVCSVEVEFAPAELQLRVSDSGSGFDTLDPLVGDSGHLGLLGIQERTRLLGGVLRIESGMGEGTRIDARLPLLEHSPTG
jgi:signal transduction histidine kinase